MSSVLNVIVGGVGGPVMVMSSPMVVYRQKCVEVGFGEKEMSKGCAVGSDQR